MNIPKSYRKMCPDFIVNDFVTNVIKTVPMRVGYNTIRVTLKNDKLTDKTSTFCAVTTLSVVSRKGCLVDIVDVVVKSAPKNDKLRDVVPVRQLFTREAFFYNTVLTELMALEDMTDKERFRGASTLLAATLDEGKEALILLSTSDVWSPRCEKWVGELTQEHVVAVVKEFGRFHALNFAFRKTNPKKFEEFKTELRAGYLSNLENPHTLKIIHNNLKAVLKFVDDSLGEKLKKFEGEVDGFLENVLNGGEGVEVLVHGDPTTNFLFSYDKSDGNSAVSQAKFFDWQLVKFGSPILDLSIFLFTNCSYDDLNTLNQFLKTYHNSLEQSLKSYQYDVNDFLPFQRLEEEWKKYAKFGLALSFLNFEILSLGLSKRPNANEDETIEEFLQCFVKPPNEDFIRRIKYVVKYCVDNELI